MSGRVEEIFIAPREGAEIVSLPEVRAVAGRGLEGDRYFHEDELDPAQEITLIEAEDLEAARREDGLELGPGEHRRNIVTRGVDLEPLIGTTFEMGHVVVEIMRPNPPCGYLQGLTGKPVVRGLRDRGGVRGRIVSDGVIRVGDEIARS